MNKFVLLVMAIFLQNMSLFQLCASEENFQEPYSSRIDYKELLQLHLECDTDANLLTVCKNILYAPEEATLQELAQMTSLYQKVYWSESDSQEGEHSLQLLHNENRLFCWLYHEIKDMQ